MALYIKVKYYSKVHLRHIDGVQILNYRVVTIQVMKIRELIEEECALFSKPPLMLCSLTFKFIEL